MRWILFAAELLLLFFTFNALFMLPGPFDSFTVIATFVGISLSAICAWFSAKGFLGFRQCHLVKFSDAVRTVPGGLWFLLTLSYLARLLQLTVHQYSR